MKLWIIYKEGIGFSKLIAEMLQDRLEELIDVSVGSSKKILPTLLVQEQFECLIIGDIESRNKESADIKDWILEFWEESKKINHQVTGISGFYIVLTDKTVEPLWIKFFREDKIKKEIFPPILRLKLNIEELVLEEKTPELIKEFAEKIIEFYIYKNEDL